MVLVVVVVTVAVVGGWWWSFKKLMRKLVCAPAGTFIGSLRRVINSILFFLQRQDGLLGRRGFPGPCNPPSSSLYFLHLFSRRGLIAPPGETSSSSEKECEGSFSDVSEDLEIFNIGFTGVVVGR